jgi:ABC-type antimicrobial peptide transport system permease subunit
MFYLRYLSAELRRRWGRTVLTAAGLGVGVALVVATTALSSGLDSAQAEVLKPLTGVGTDMTVSRPLSVDQNDKGFTGLSTKEQKQLQKENGGNRLDFGKLGKPGSKFSTDILTGGSQLSFPSHIVDQISALSGVDDVAGSLALTSVHTSGTVPKFSQSPGAAPSGPQAGGTFSSRPEGKLKVDQFSITGIDVMKPGLAPVSLSQVTDGKYLSASPASRGALVSTGYAADQDLSIGDGIEIGGRKFSIVGLVKQPLGGAASDVYVQLHALQKVSGRKGRINTLAVRASSTEMVARVASSIPKVFSGAEVTTAQDLADQVHGSLVDMSKLVDRLGFVLKLVGLGAAFLIACFLTLSSVAKRVRELGTLKAIGWTRSKVVRQVSLESLAQGLVGGAIGAALGALAITAFNALGVTLKATVAAAQQAAAAGPVIRPPGQFGSGAASTVTGSTSIALHAPLDGNLVLLAIGLALLGGLLAGGVGGLRAARLRPARALQTVG